MKAVTREFSSDGYKVIPLCSVPPLGAVTNVDPRSSVGLNDYENCKTKTIKSVYIYKNRGGTRCGFHSALTRLETI